jgi:hypothetical protein
LTSREPNVEHSLNGLSVPEERSRYFGHRFGSSRNGAVVTVKAGDCTADADEILTRYGADLGDNVSAYDYTQAPAPPAPPHLKTKAMSSPLERCSPSTKTESPAARSDCKEVITKTQTVQVPVTLGELVIERRSAVWQTVQPSWRRSVTVLWYFAMPCLHAGALGTAAETYSLALLTDLSFTSPLRVEKQLV